LRRILAVASAVLVLAGCGGGQQQPSVDPAKTLRDGAAAVGALKTVSATLKFTKGGITFQGFTLASAKATVVLPDESDTFYTIKDQDLSISIEVIISAGHVYIRPPFSTFVAATPADAAAIPDLAKLFNPASGLPALIPAGTSPKFVSTDQVDGVSAYQVTTTYTPQQVHNMLSQLSSAGGVQARIWVDAGDHLIRKAVLDGDFGDGGKPATVEVDLSGFNASVVIASPTP
jgi:lipoprotein LprG